MLTSASGQETVTWTRLTFSSETTTKWGKTHEIMFFIQDTGHQSTEDAITEKQVTNCKNYSTIVPFIVLRVSR